jgi:hypothetical protein
MSETVVHIDDPIIAINITLIGSRALVVYVDVDGPSAANNRPWLRK